MSREEGSTREQELGVRVCGARVEMRYMRDTATLESSWKKNTEHKTSYSYCTIVYKTPLLHRVRLQNWYGVMRMCYNASIVNTLWPSSHKVISMRLEGVCVCPYL